MSHIVLEGLQEPCFPVNSVIDIVKHGIQCLYNTSVKLAAEAVGVVNNICHLFEKENSNCKSNSDNHSCPSFEKDYQLILNILEEQKVFVSNTTGRQHSTFKKQKWLLEQLCYTDLIKWIK